MPAPTTVQELLILVRQSGLVDDAALKRYAQQQRTALVRAADAQQAARLLVRDQLLTLFQVQQLLQGKWRRFTIGGYYTVLDQIGTGGFGLVYLCQHRHMRRKVAVKVLPLSKAADPSVVERFQREGRAAAALNHPNIVRAYDVGQDGNLHFLAMEYVEGATLHEIVKRHGPLGPLQAVHYMRQAALGLAHAHQAGVVHRDIKPGNLLVDLTGTVKILDFGLARFCQDEGDNLTVKYGDQVLGTVDYLAPEQAVNSHDVDIRADIYSLGATIYYCLTGSPPFPQGNLTQKLILLSTRKPQPIAAFRDDVPAGLSALVEQSMAKDRNGRYQTPAELVRALGALPILAGETNGGGGDRTLTKPDQWGRSRPSKPYGLVAAARRLAAMLKAAWRRITSKGGPPPRSG